MIPLTIIAVYVGVPVVLGAYAHFSYPSPPARSYFLARLRIRPSLLLMSLFGTTMTAFALIGSTGEAFKHGIGVYGLMASWSGIIHSACFFFVGVKFLSIASRYCFTTQIHYYRARFDSPMLGV